MPSRVWDIQLDGQDVRVTAEWSGFWGSGRVLVNGRRISNWGAPVKFKRHAFDLVGYAAELVRADPNGLTFDLRLFVAGRDAADLPLPRGLGAALVADSQRGRCPKCAEEVSILIYNTGQVEAVCPSCGRIRL